VPSFLFFIFKNSNRKGILFALILFCPFFSHAQGTWVWTHGANTANSPGNYGTQNVTAPTNDPPGMFEPYDFTDLQGNFWVFGGYKSTLFQCYNDLWKFNPLTNMWTWVNGSGTVNTTGNYGTQGVASPTNQPGGRFHGFSWVDAQGNFWIFGGFGYDANGFAGYLNDLWKYDMTTGEWTWMKGPNTANTAGSYGILQAPSPSNNPEARAEGATAWTANNGELWLFGGKSQLGFLSDMWRYSPATNMWTWMSGPNTINNFANFGTTTMLSIFNTPGGRSCFARWKDSGGNFWLFGGIQNGNTFNDMWKYDPVLNEWAYMGGTQLWNDAGNYGNYCEVNGYIPSGRTETRCTWKDSCDRMWFMGGNNSGFLSAAVNDIWFFDPAVNEFSIIGGNSSVNQPGNFGTILVPAPSNYPPTNCGSLGFTDNAGNFWLFGGLLNAIGDNTNAIWKYTRPQHCPTYIFSIVPNSPNGCAPLPVNFTLNPTSAGFTYQWNFGDPATAADTSIAQSPAYTYTAVGTFTVSVIISNPSPCNVFIDTVTTTITVNSIPAPNIGNDTTICGPMNLFLNAGITGNSYLWNTGDTLQSINITAAGTYSVTVIQNGCPGIDSIVVTNLVAPNLGLDSAFCQGGNLNLNVGFWDSYLWSNGSVGPTLNVNSTGTYFVNVSTAPCNFTDTIQVTVNPIPQVNLGPDSLLCPGNIYTLDAGNPGATYSWNTGDVTQTVAASTAGYYNVVVTQNNCSGVGDVQLTYLPQLDLGPPVAFCNTESMEISAGPPGFNYLWNTGDTSNSISVYTAGIYGVQIQNGNCTFSDSIEVTGAPGNGLLFVPNAFTPNYNGLNDNFKAYGDGIRTFHMMIFDRWGELVFESYDMNESWNGDPHGKVTISNVFVYKITYTTECSGEQEIEKIGSVTLVR
jgi:gliding motility-associated-like protein